MKKMKKLHLLLAALLFTLLIPVCKPTIVEAATLKAPKTLTVKQGRNNISVQWSKVSGAKGYVVYRKTSPSQGWKRLKVVKAPTLKYLDKNIASGKNYYYTVRPYTSKSGKNTYGSYNKSGRNTVYLKEPKVKATKSATSVTLKWNKTTGASGYEVYRKSGSSGYSKVKTTTALSYKDMTVEPNTKYTYAIRAYKKSGSSVFRSLYYDGANLVSVKTQTEDPVEPDPEPVVPDINDAVDSKVYVNGKYSIIEIYNKSIYDYYGVQYRIDFYGLDGSLIYCIPTTFISECITPNMKDYATITLPDNFSYSNYKVNLNIQDNYDIIKYKKQMELAKSIKVNSVNKLNAVLQINLSNMSNDVLSVSIKCVFFRDGVPLYTRYGGDKLNVRETKDLYVTYGTMISSDLQYEIDNVEVTIKGANVL